MQSVRPEPRRRMRASDRREQILDITHAIVDAEGFHAATLGRIAAEAGVTRTVLYHQFGDLAALLVALVDRESARTAAQFAGTIAATGRATEQDGVLGAAFPGI